MATTNRPQIVVVGVDYSSTSDLALMHALEIASRTPDAEVHAVHAAAAFPSLVGLQHGPEPLPAVTTPHELELELERHVDRCLARFVNNTDPAAPIPERIVLHVAIGSPADEIALVARELEAHLVIVGTHGRQGLSRMLLGSVAEGVVRMAPCPVLVVRPREVPAAPRIEPPCEHCVRTRFATGGQRLWCHQHSESHGQRHTYHQGDRVASDGSMPLIFHG
jgi:nucleotide-binding universal stress UspA family protein